MTVCFSAMLYNGSPLMWLAMSTTQQYAQKQCDKGPRPQRQSLRNQHKHLFELWTTTTPPAKVVAEPNRCLL